MAFTNANLHSRPGAAGSLQYTYVTTSDAMATVLAAGYFHNTTYSTNFVFGDQIFAICTDGSFLLKVASLSSGSVTCQFVTGNLPVGTFGTATAAECGSMPAIGFYEAGTSICTATRYVLPTPYAGAEIIVRRIDSGTEAIAFDAGASAGATLANYGGTGLTYDATLNLRIVTRYEGDYFHLVGKSTTRWRIRGYHFGSSGSEDLGGGGSAFFPGT